MSKRLAPTQSATKFKIGTIKKGNNNELWIVTKTKNGVKRWTRHKNIIDLSTIVSKLQVEKDFSLIVPKQKYDVYFTKNELCLNILSKYTKNIKFCVPIKQVGMTYYKKNINKFIYIYFIKNESKYIIYGKTNTSIKKYSNELSYIYTLTNKSVPYQNKVYEPSKVITDHHYGKLIILTKPILKYLKNKKYYTVWGQTWNKDYSGKYSIIVLQYDGIIKKNNKIYIKGRIYTQFKKTSHALNLNKDIIISLDKNNIFSTGTTNDPIYLVSKWRRGFKISKKLPKGELFKLPK